MNYSYLTFIAVICFSFFSNLEATKWNTRTIEEIKGLLTELQPLLENKQFHESVNAHRSFSPLFGKQPLFGRLVNNISYFIENSSDKTKKEDLKIYFSNITKDLRTVLYVVDRNYKDFNFSFIGKYWNHDAQRFYLPREATTLWNVWSKKIELLVEINEELNKKLCTVM